MSRPFLMLVYFRINTIIRSICCMLAIFILLFACSRANEKKETFIVNGQAYFNQGDYFLARLQFKQALRIDPSMVDGYYNLGLAEIHLGNVKQALSSFLKVIELQPDHLEAQIQIGKIMLDAGFPEKAIQRANLVLAIHEKDQTALKLKATALLQQDKNQEKIETAAQILEQLLKSGEVSADIYHQAATALLHQNKIEKAQAKVAEGLAINPNNLSLYELLAKIYLRQDEKKNAIRTYHRLVTMSPENPDYIFNLAELLWQSNQKDNAQKILAQRMLTVGSEDDSTWIRLARFYAQKNEYDLSQNTLIAGLQIHPNSFKLRLALTRMLVNLENYTKAIEWLHPYLLKSQHQTGMQISDAQLLLAKSFLAIGELIKAEQYVDAYLENYPRSRNGHFIKGTIHLLNNDPHSATSEFWSIVEADPLNDMARVELAHAMTRTDQWQEALDILNEGVKQKEDDIILRHALFNIHLRLKNYGQAENQLEKIISKSPEKDQTMILLANFYQTIGAFNKAEDTYKTILSKIPHEVTAHLELSKLYIRERKNKNAINQLKNAHAVIPASEEILTTLVDLYIKQKKYNTAKETINKRLKSDPQNGWLHILLSRIYMAMQQYEKAESQLKTVLHFQPDLVDAHISYMELLYHQQKKDQILFHFQSVIENYPNAIAPQIALAKFYILEKKYSRAIDIYESMVIKDDALFDIARDLVFSLCSHPRDQKDFAKALSLAKKMLSNRPEDAKAIDSVGWAYYHQGNLDRAQGYLHRALNLSPNLFSGLYHLAKVCIDADEVKTAEYALERILTYHGESKEKKDAQKILKNLRSKNRLQR